MRFRPRHYVLIAVIVMLGIFNYIRSRRARIANPGVPVSVASGPVAQSSAWTAFDRAAALRDAAEAQFTPALQQLQQTIAHAPANDSTIAGVKGCQTWLLFYRQGVLHPSRDTSWRDRSTEHLNACMKTHQDAD